MYPAWPEASGMGNLYWKRVYEPVTRDDGFRILIDRIWPGGLKKQILIY